MSELLPGISGCPHFYLAERSIWDADFGNGYCPVSRAVLISTQTIKNYNE